MMYKTHLIGGISSGIIFSSMLIPHLQTPLFTASGIIVGSMIGSWIPDLDKKTSHMSRKLKLVSFLVRTAADGHHRGLIHTPILSIGLSTLLFYASLQLKGLFIFQLFLLGLSVGIGIGMLSHIFLDFLTVEGVPLLYPFSKKKYHLLPIKTNGFGERIVAMLMVIFTIVFLFHAYQPQLLQHII